MSNVANRIVNFVRVHQGDTPRHMSVHLSNGDDFRFSSIVEYSDDVLVLKHLQHTYYVDADSVINFIVHD